jgi:hypothetical protein
MFQRFEVKEVITHCESVSYVDYRFIPGASPPLYCHLRFGSTQSFLHHSVEVVLHHLERYVSCFHASLDMYVEGVIHNHKGGIVAHS